MPPLSQTPETNFQRIRRIMEEPPTDFDPGELAPWGEKEFSAFAEKEAVELQPRQTERPQ